MGTYTTGEAVENLLARTDIPEWELNDLSEEEIDDLWGFGYTHNQFDAFVIIAPDGTRFLGTIVEIQGEQ